MDEKLLRAVLVALPVTGFRFYETVGSTNDLALAWLGDGAPDGALVVADEQTSGRGRLDRRWITNPGGALAFSMIIRPRGDELSRLPLFAPLAGLAVSHAFEELGLSPEIKWPNDVLLERRKVCGILVEASWSGSELDGIVVGIGVNIAPSSVPAQNEVMFPAGCVEQVLGRPVERVWLLSRILAAFFEERPALDSDRFLKQWERRLAFRAELVTVEPPSQPAVTGMLSGIDRSGNLVLVTGEGEEITIQAGDVARMRPMV